MAPLYPDQTRDQGDINFSSTGPEDMRFLSNFAYSPMVIPIVAVSLEGGPFIMELHFKTVEHAYQYVRARIRGLELIARQIYIAPTAARAKQIGRGARAVPGTPFHAFWRRESQLIMKSLLLRKFSDPILGAKLIATGNRCLVEATTDQFWGIGLTSEQISMGGVATGRNVLGFQLHYARAYLQATPGAGPPAREDICLANNNVATNRAPVVGRYGLMCIPHASTEILFLVASFLNTVFTRQFLIIPGYTDFYCPKAPWNMFRAEETPDSYQSGDNTPRARRKVLIPQQLRRGILLLSSLNPTLEKITLVQYLPQPFSGFSTPWCPDKNLELSKVQQNILSVNIALENLVPELGPRYQCVTVPAEHFYFGHFLSRTGEFQPFLNRLGRERFRQHLERAVQE